jgi:DNA polymerase-3 subunit delta
VPSLDLQALERKIAARQLAPVHVFIGTDVRLIERLVDAIEATIDEADRPFAVDRLYAAEPGGSPVDIASSAQVLPMLGDRRLVIVRRAERLLKPKRASKPAETDSDEPVEDAEDSGADLTALEEYVAQPADFSTLLFVATEADRTRRFTKRLLEKAQVTRFDGFNVGSPADRAGARRDAAAQLRGELAQAGRAIDRDALEMLITRAGGEISKLRGDVERLLLYTQGQARISASDVAEVTAIERDIDDWAVTNALGAGDAAAALREVGVRLDRGDSPHMLMGKLRWWVANRLVERAPERVRPALDALLRTDLALKSSGGEDRVLIERLVVELSARR